MPESLKWIWRSVPHVEAGGTVSPWIDNVMVERLWRMVKYEVVYLEGYDNMSHARRSMKNYFAFYNGDRRHQSVDERTPDDVYYNTAARLAA